jgi:hypothetical protein
LDIVPEAVGWDVSGSGIPQAWSFWNPRNDLAHYRLVVTATQPGNWSGVVELQEWRLFQLAV